MTLLTTDSMNNHRWPARVMNSFLSFPYSFAFAAFSFAAFAFACASLLAPSPSRWPSCPVPDRGWARRSVAEDSFEAGDHARQNLVAETTEAMSRITDNQHRQPMGSATKLVQFSWMGMSRSWTGEPQRKYDERTGSTKSLNNCPFSLKGSSRRYSTSRRQHPHNSDLECTAAVTRRSSRP